jgi:hypothetical protein
MYLVKIKTTEYKGRSFLSHSVFQIDVQASVNFKELLPFVHLKEDWYKL